MKKLFICIILCLISLAGCTEMSEQTIYVGGNAQSGSDTVSSSANYNKDEVATKELSEFFAYSMSDVCELATPMFESVEFLEQYLRTGDSSFSDLYTIPVISETESADEVMKRGYLSIKDIFGINFDEIPEFQNIGVDILSTPAEIYSYYFDGGVTVMVTSAAEYFTGRSVKEYCEAYNEAYPNMKKEYNYRTVGGLDFASNEKIDMTMIDAYLITIYNAKKEPSEFIKNIKDLFYAESDAEGEAAVKEIVEKIKGYNGFQ